MYLLISPHFLQVSQTHEIDPEGNSVESNTTVTILENDVVQVQTSRKWTKTTSATYVTKHIGPLYESPLGNTYTGVSAPESTGKTTDGTAATASGPLRAKEVRSTPLTAGQTDEDGSIRVGEAKVVKAKEPLPDLARHMAKTYQSRWAGRINHEVGIFCLIDCPFDWLTDWLLAWTIE